MVIFEARDPGTGNDVWLADSRLANLPRLMPTPGQSLVVLAAHPDDETLGAGGLIAAARSAGGLVTVVLVTDGSGSHGPEIIDENELIALRRAEFARALEILDVSGSVQLVHRDGHVREARAVIRAEVSGVVRNHPGCVLVAPWRGDGHRDHRVLGEIAAEIASEHGLTFWEYPIWLWQWADPDGREVPWDRMVTLSLSAAQTMSKRAAVDVYESQTSRRGSEPPQLHARFLENFFRPFEVFITTTGPLVTVDHLPQVDPRDGVAGRTSAGPQEGVA